MNEITLDRVTAEHFMPLVGQNTVITVPSGAILEVTVDSVRMAPLSRLPGLPEGHRASFSVFLVAHTPGDFVDGGCDMECTAGLLKNLFISRVAPAGRDPLLAYYQIIFN